MSSIRLVLLITVSRLLNWVICLGDVFVLTWCGCHLQPTGCKQTHSLLMLGGRLPSASCSSSRFPIQIERETSAALFFWGGGVVVPPPLRLSLGFFFPLLAICLFLSVQLTTLIRQPDNESQREAMHLQLRLLPASAGCVCVCVSLTYSLFVFDCMLRL